MIQCKFLILNFLQRVVAFIQFIAASAFTIFNRSLTINTFDLVVFWFVIVYGKVSSLEIFNTAGKSCLKVTNSKSRMSH